jgi:hypothetical protein
MVYCRVVLHAASVISLQLGIRAASVHTPLDTYIEIRYIDRRANEM